MNESNVERFRAAYLETLKAAVERNPGDYAYTVEQVPVCVNMMLPALAKGGANLSPAIKAAAKKCGIKGTMGAIKAFLTEGETP